MSGEVPAHQVLPESPRDLGPLDVLAQLDPVALVIGVLVTAAEELHLAGSLVRILWDAVTFEGDDIVDHIRDCDPVTAFQCVADGLRSHGAKELVLEIAIVVRLVDHDLTGSLSAVHPGEPDQPSPSPPSAAAESQQCSSRRSQVWPLAARQR